MSDFSDLSPAYTNTEIEVEKYLSPRSKSTEQKASAIPDYSKRRSNNKSKKRQGYNAPPKNKKQKTFRRRRRRLWNPPNLGRSDKDIDDEYMVEHPNEFKFLQSPETSPKHTRREQKLKLTRTFDY